MKTSKKTALLFLVTLLITCICAFVACDSAKTLGVSSSVNGEAFDFETAEFDFLTDVVVPEATLDGIESSKIISTPVTYKFTSPTYREGRDEKVDVYESFFPVIFVDVVGEWKVEYIFGDQTIQKTFDVVDTVAPTLSEPIRPYDVYADATKKYSLPSFTPEDPSGIDYGSESMIKTLTLNGEPLAIDGMDRYIASEPGECIYEFSVCDKYGNRSSTTVKWNVKEKDWIDENLDENYLADYDEEGYINTASSGNMSAYWNNTALYEEWLEEYEGAEGVLKLSAAPNTGYSLGAFKLDLQKTITASDLTSKYLVLRIYTTCDLGWLRYGCKSWQDERKVEATHNMQININANEWTTVVMNTAELKYGYFDLGDDIDCFQIAFGTYQTRMTKDLVLYVDSVTLSSKLPTATGLNVDGTTFTWDAVANVDGYEVYDGDQMTVVTTNSYTASSQDAALAVRPIANEANVLSISADYPVPYIDMSGFEDYDVAPIDTSAYTYLFVKNDYNAARPAKSLTAEYLDEYKGEKGVVKVTTINNANGIGDICMNLPKLVPNGCTVKFLIESSDARYLRFFQPHSESGVELATGGAAPDLHVSEDWQTVYLNYKKNYVNTPDDRIDMMVQGGTAGSANVVYFSIVANGDATEIIDKIAYKDLQEQLAAELASGYLATFDEEAYADLVVPSMTSTEHQAKQMSVEYLSSFEGETGVVKATVVSNDSGFADIMIVLPKAMTSYANGYTLKYYLETESEDKEIAWVIRPYGTKDITPSTHNDGYLGVDSWQTISVSDSGSENNTDIIAIRIKTAKTFDGETKLYLAWVKDGAQ